MAERWVKGTRKTDQAEVWVNMENATFIMPVSSTGKYTMGTQVVMNTICSLPTQGLQGVSFQIAYLNETFEEQPSHFLPKTIQ